MALVIAAAKTQALSGPLGPVDVNTRYGETANPPRMIGNSATSMNTFTGNRVTNSWQGLTGTTQLCYDVMGPGGRAILIAGDRCGGYCFTDPIDVSICMNTFTYPDDKLNLQECGSCVGKATNIIEPGPPCVGTALPLYSANVPSEQKCDWCASNNHPHFDMDIDTYNHICGAEADAGHCELSFVEPFICLNAPMLVSCPPNSYEGTCYVGDPSQSITLASGAFCCCSSSYPKFNGKACVVSSL